MPNDDESSIAIVAMECRIPQASDVDALWDLLMQEKYTITDLQDEQIQQAGVAQEVLGKPNYVKRAGILDDIDRFDAGYFDIGAKEADVLDVQQRAMLESAVTLLNRGNIDPARSKQRIGVFAGSAFSSYLFGVLERDDLIDALGEMVVRHGNDKDFLATRTSYKLNLKGPSLNVQTSCSTGIVAVHVACQSLLLNECDAAIAGAVCIKLPQDAGYLYQEDGVLSPDGNCRPFAADSNGTIFTNGLGLVLLKRLSDAVDDGDEIVAVIKASAINNDGSMKVGFTAPSVTGQVEALRDAIQIADINPEDIQYIEAHGTGTALGDPIEVDAIRQAYGEAGTPCGIGSLKANFGHFNIAAGIIGLIKAALILKHKKIPATLHVKEVNPNLGLEQSRFYVTGRSTELDTSRPQIVAVSAFGMGGTNSHVILQNHEDRREVSSPSEESYRIFTLSAKSEGALNRLAGDHQAYFSSDPFASFADAAHTAYFCRPLLPNRLAFVARSHKEALSRLKSGQYNRRLSKDSRLMAFVFSGQGTQNVDMGSTLAGESPQFKQQLDRVLAVFKVEHGLDLSAYLWNRDKEQDISSTLITQPLLFAVEFALARTLLDIGVAPNYVFGHSLGELIAAAVSGVFDLQTAAAVVMKRAQSMVRCEPGAMLAAESLDGLEELLQERAVSVAAHNSPKQFVVSGGFEQIDAAADIFKSRGFGHQRLKTSHAFHSHMMRQAAAEFLEFMKGVPFNDARIPIVSNITGRILTEYEYKNPIYWSDHLLRSVQFAKSVQTLHELGVRNFIEIGHGYAMSNLVQANLATRPNGESKVVQALGGVDEEYSSFLNTIAAYWTMSDRVALDPFVVGRRRAALPAYPFDRTRHWIEPVIGFGKRGARMVETPASCQQMEAAASTPGASQGPTHPAPQPVEHVQDNPVESVVADIYATYLGSADIDRQTAFFDLGGNSLIAIQLINKLRETFQLDIPMRGFYENSSIADISLQIANKLLEGAKHG
ncbi:acyltransferase domain-containing protein [Noviherbaspirillum cavernae]|uniref:Acyltransferase domain-containing protein n=1 Tax=Noviherbaspirillum cavernae TaxID=2320862 RepID=A0A418X229_9BURK|nr:type I polyketide synthase [Noviherbaspirillum cavernae]RJG06514.1 acyltransferase domain-containing protein [Noviherbaspirillum cavernae]